MNESTYVNVFAIHARCGLLDRNTTIWLQNVGRHVGNHRQHYLEWGPQISDIIYFYSSISDPVCVL